MGSVFTSYPVVMKEFWILGSKRCMELVFSVAHEQWEKSGKPEQAYWFHHYLNQSEENYV